MAGLLASIRVLFAKNWRIKQRESRLNKSRPTTPGAWLFPPMITDVVLPLVFILYLIQLFCSINQQVGDVNAGGFATRELQNQAQEAMKWSLPSLSTSSSAVQAMTALPLLLTVTNMSLVTLDRPENRAFLAYLDRVYAGDASLGLVPPSAKTIVVPVPPNTDINAVDAYLEAYPRTSGVAIYAAFDVRRVTSLAPYHARVFLYENDNHDPLRPKMPNDQVDNYFTVNVQGGDDDGRVLTFPGVLPLQMELNLFLREPHAASPSTVNKKNETISPVRACRLVDSMLYLSGLSWQDLPGTSQLGGGEASCEKAIKAGRVGAKTLEFLARFDKQEASMDAMKSLNVHSLPKRPKKTISGPVESSIVFYMAYLFLWPFSRLVRDIVVEKEKQLKEYLLIMGLQPMALLVSWFLVYLVASFAVVAIAVVMLSDSMFVGTQSSQVYFFMLLLAFALSMLLFGLAITPMFSSARTAAAAAPLMYLVLSAAPFLTSWIGEDAVEHSALRFVVWFMDQASSPVVFMDAIHGVVALDGVTAKIRPIAWETVAGPTWKMVVQSVGYLVLGWYLENVFPRAFGVQQPWYFVVQPSYWAPNRFGSGAASLRAGAAARDEEELVGLTAEQEEANSSSFAEDDTMREMAMADYLRHFRPILLVKALTKRYPNGKLAVNNVSFGVKKGEIFGLLGPNGAGKSTTMSILCGMLAPTAGDAFVGASSVVTDPLSIRKSLSVCFQQNILFDDLTVWEHLKLVYKLKTALGIKAIDEEMWIHKLVHFGLDDKRDALSKTLSGGQKRKLSLVLALMDTSRVVLLDEPTAGMDLKARVDTWDALKKAVSHRAVILTTHSMQEAQALCENIGIVADGKLKCCGSSLFLREKFGVGYKLTIVHHEENDKDGGSGGKSNKMRTNDSTKGDAMLAAVKRHVPQAELLSHNKWETRIQLNSDEPATLIPVFDELEKMKRVETIKRYAVAATDLEDVFVRVTDGGDVYYHVKDGANKTPEETKMESSQKQRPAPPSASLESHDSRRTDVEAMPLQVRALLTKRWKLMVRDKRAFLAHYIWPLVLFVVLMAIGARQPGGGGDYLETITSLPTSASSSSLFVGSLPGASAATQRILDQVDPAVRARIKWQQVETPAQIVDIVLHNDTNTAFFGAVLVRNVTLAQEEDDDKLLQFSIYYNDTIPRSLPVTLQWMATAYCKTLPIHGDSDPRECELSFTKSAFPRRSLFTMKAGENGKAAEVEIHPQGKTGDNLAQRFIVAIYILITLNSITSNYITTVVKERENGLKRLQYLHLASERASTVYWLAHLVFDYIGYAVALAVVFVIVMAYGMAWPSELMVALVVQSLAFGLSTLAFSYLFSLAFASHSSAQSVMSYVATFQLLGCSMLFALGTVPSLCSKVATVAMFLRILPLVAYGEAVLNFATMELSLLRNQCISLSAAATTSSPASASFLDSMKTSLAMNGGDLAAPSPWDWTVGGRPLAYLLSSFVLYMALLFVVDAMQSYPTLLQNRLDWLLRRQPARMSRLPRDIETPSRDIIEVEHLTKVFNPKKKTTSQSSEQHATTGHTNGVDNGDEEDGGRPVLNASGQVVAVDDVSFTVERNDCVALLGVNGSGKSTTFEVLTSGIAPTSGSAYLDGIDVTLQPQLASRQYGYCPQTNIQFAELSVREHLQLFYRLRTRDHYTVRQEEAVLQNLMATLDLHQVENTTAGHLSGGNKRRLMLALSLLSADVELLLMDEPSAGVDVVARRLMWKVLYERRQGNRELSCLFTTHSMEEAEAVCANAVVLNKGKLVWNGSIPELKHYAARGISITLRLDTASLWEQERVRYYVDRIRTALSPYTQDTIASDELEKAWRVCREHNPRTKLLAAATPSEQQWITALVARVQQEHGVTNSSTTTTTTTEELNQVATPARMDTTEFVKEWLLREAFATIEVQLFADLITAKSHEQVQSVDLQNAMGSGTSSTAVYETNCNDEFGLLDVFQTMEQHKQAFAIARYSISELSLERVFEQFT